MEYGMSNFIKLESGNDGAKFIINLDCVTGFFNLEKSDNGNKTRIYFKADSGLEYVEVKQSLYDLEKYIEMRGVIDT